MQIGLEVIDPQFGVTVMGLIGPNGWCNWNERFWGRSPTGPDITDKRGYWLISSWTLP